MKTFKRALCRLPILTGLFSIKSAIAFSVSHHEPGRLRSICCEIFHPQSFFTLFGLSRWVETDWSFDSIGRRLGKGLKRDAL